MEASSAAAAPRDYVLLGDALRGIACVVVVLYHAILGTALFLGGPYAADPTGAFGLLSRIGIRIGSPTVYVFFALSGYLVGGPWVRAWVRGDGRFPRPLRYVGRRARRILPAFWLVITLQLLLGGAYSFSDAEVLGTYLLVQTTYGGAQQELMPQGWTVDVEAAYYLTLPLLGLLAGRWATRGTRRDRQRALLVLSLGWGLVGLWLRTRYAPDSGIGRNALSLGWAFVPGMLLAAYEEELKAALRPRPDLAKRLALACVGAALAAEALVVWRELDDGLLLAELAHLVCGGGFLAAALLWQWGTGGAPRALDSRPVHALGRWSYGTYLLHVLIGRELLERLPRDLGPYEALAAVAVPMLVLSLGFAALMWWLWEEPWLEWRRPRLSWRAASAPPRPPTEERAPAA